MTKTVESIWQTLRGDMRICEKWAYFDHAAVAPLSTTVAERVQEWLTDMTVDGTVCWPKWRKLIEHGRRITSRMLNCKTSELAFVHSTTEGINLISDGYPWKPGDNVVTLDSEFPSNLYPWLQLEDRGVEVRKIATSNERWDLDQLREACDGKTRIVTVSWVSYVTGWRNQLAEIADIAHAAGALLFVDGIQGLGVLPLDVQETPIDFLAADGHKWLLGPEGAGVLYIREEHLERLRPIGIGWNSVRHAGQFHDHRLVLKTDASRYEGGTFNMVGLAALVTSLEWFESAGVPAISERLKQVTDELVDRLERAGLTCASDRTESRWSGIVSCDHPTRSPEELKRECADRNVAINCRGGHLRLSPHVYTNTDDIDRIVAVVS